ncbi:MAG: lipid-binding SYLF domain-containing protein [Candidatus Korobacteraceae bacterium]
MKKISIALLAFLTTAAWAQSGARSADIERVQSATTILSQIMEAPDRGIPDSIMSGAKCIAIVPSMLKVSFIFGANYGKGVATCRTATGWSSPAFFRIEGGSFGFQAGGQASDLVLIIRTDDGMQHLLQSKFKLGADASAAAGPVGRDAQAATDLTMRAQVLTYSRSRGLFLGVSLSGAVIRQDDGDVRAFYGKDWTFYSLLNGEVPPPQDSLALLNAVERYAPTKRAALPAAGSVSAPAPTPAAAPAPAEAAPATAPAVDPASTSTAAPVEPTATASPATAPAKVPAPAAVPASTAPADPADPGNSLR